MSAKRLAARMFSTLGCLPVTLLVLGACSRNADLPATGPQASAPASSPDSQAAPKRFGLGISGYNYTNTAIESFRVSYAGGDTLSVSSPGGGGSGTVCCVSLWLPLSHAPNINVQWWRNGKTCEITVPLSLPVPPEPKTMAVHFFEDGHIDVEASDDVYPPPRLKLERHSRTQRHADATKNVVNDERFAKCTDGYRTI